MLSDYMPMLDEDVQMEIVSNTNHRPVVAVVHFTGGPVTLRGRTDGQGYAFLHFTVLNTKPGVPVRWTATVWVETCGYAGPSYFTPRKS